MGVGGGTERLRWGDFAGYEGVLKDLQRRLAPTHVPTHAPHVSGEGVRRLAVRPLAGVVLHGPSGCGKSLLAAVMASELRMNFVPIRCTDLLSRYFGQTEAAVRTLFRRARNAAPALLFFDDFDLLAHRRSDGEVEGSGGLQGRVLSTLLNELDGILGPPSAPTAPPFPSSSLPGAASGFPGFPGMGGGGGWGGGGYGGGLAGVLVVAACREARQLDEALLRPGYATPPLPPYSNSYPRIRTHSPYTSHTLHTLHFRTPYSPHTRAPGVH
ncbi:P-loop containing nucleoside triphosphate hydrolase protein [Ochromonadaceae sp. CCMP2298]|nr:P-loop containing nucleoside triphosphate hydrolase protein [Ochromonadaceae sp. CCMP2298]